MNAKKNEIELRKKAGVKVSAEEEAQQLYNTALSSYISLAQKAAEEGIDFSAVQQQATSDIAGFVDTMEDALQDALANKEFAENIKSFYGEIDAVLQDTGAKTVEEYSSLLQALRAH